MKDRLFLGIPVPHEPTIHFYRHTAELAQAQPLRIVSPPNYHVTVSFFGEVAQEERGEIVEGIHDVTDKTAPFTLFYKDVVAAPPRDPHRMIWARFEDSEPFNDLVASIEDTFGTRIPAEQYRKNQPPIPHVTLARKKPGHPIQPERLLVPRFAIPPIELRVNECLLFASTLHPSGPRYQPIEIFSLNNTN